MTQADTKRAIANWVTYHGQYGVVMNISGLPIKGSFEKLRRNPDMSGMGDILIGWKGALIQVEVKRKVSEKLRQSQDDHKSRTERAGCQYWTVTGLDDFIEQLEEYKLKRFGIVAGLKEL